MNKYPYSKSRNFIVGAIFSVVLSILAVNSAFANYRCETDMEKAIQSYDLSGKTISRTSIVEIYEGHQGGGMLDAYEAWISFKECDGNLIVRLDRACYVDTAYTKGSCSIKGLKNY